MYNKNIFLTRIYLLAVKPKKKNMNYCVLRSGMLWNKQVMERGIRPLESYKSIRHLSGNVEGDIWIYGLGVHWRGLTWKDEFLSFSVRCYLAMELDWKPQGISVDRTVVQGLSLDSL